MKKKHKTHSITVRQKKGLKRWRFYPTIDAMEYIKSYHVTSLTLLFVVQLQLVCVLKCCTFHQHLLHVMQSVNYMDTTYALGSMASNTPLRRVIQTNGCGFFYYFSSGQMALVKFIDCIFFGSLQNACCFFIISSKLQKIKINIGAKSFYSKKCQTVCSHSDRGHPVANNKTVTKHVKGTTIQSNNIFFSLSHTHKFNKPFNCMVLSDKLM